METKRYTTIIGTGSYIPPTIMKNEDFLDSTFYDPSTHKKFERNNEDIIQKFLEITSIEERRYALNNHNCSDLASIAAIDACDSANIDPENLDFILVAHNFGDASFTNEQTDVVPSLANKVKHNLNIKNPKCFAHDVISGCPGWTTAMIVADAYIKSGIYNRGLVIGADICSRHADPYDRDKLIFSDGAGAVVVESKESDTPVGILSHSSQSDSIDGIDWLKLGKSVNLDKKEKDLYIRMQGNKVYVYALSNVPSLVKESIDKAGLHLEDISKVLIHQANEKMDQAILKRIFKLYGKREVNWDIMPMTIHRLGNSSSATVPTLLDLITKKQLDNHDSFKSGDVIVMASVGAGMNINSIIYKMP